MVTELVLKVRRPSRSQVGDIEDGAQVAAAQHVGISSDRAIAGEGCSGARLGKSPHGDRAADTGCPGGDQHSVDEVAAFDSVIAFVVGHKSSR